MTETKHRSQSHASARSTDQRAVLKGVDVDQLVGRSRALRHALHRNPEVSGEESNTAERIIEYLEAADLTPVATGVGGHGIIYRIQGEGETTEADEDQMASPVRLFRSDIDALPLHERTDVPYRSQIDGVHHACGHDGHSAMLATALGVLAEGRDRWSGTILGVFQPAEETGAGAKAMLDDGVDLTADVAYGFHNLPGCELGNVVVREGPMACASVGLDMRFQGSTAHASEPYEGRDPIPAAATLLLRALGMPGEVLPMGRAALVTPIAIAGGRRTYGTAAGDARLSLTVRADHESDMDEVVERIFRHARALADDGTFELQLDTVERFPGCDNHAKVVAFVHEAAKDIGAPITTPARPRPWSEDFGHFLKQMPGALIGLGSGPEHPELHTPNYDFPDELLETGIRLWCRLAEGPAPRK